MEGKEKPAEETKDAKKKKQSKSTMHGEFGGKRAGREAEKLLQGEPKGGVLPALGQRNCHKCRARS